MVWCNRSVSVICLVLAIVKCVNGQVIGQQQLLNKLVCIEQEVCGQCLSAASHCRWCADPYFSNTVPRCNHYESLVAASCSQEMIQKPEEAVFEVLANRSLQDMGESEEAVVQIQPQRIRLSLKPRETRKIKFSYRPARNYPLDLYYLMDLTWSMKDDKETLVSLRDDLPNLLKNLTDNFRLGFGSFADKPLMPFISMDSRRRANPCAVEEQACEPTYSFRHHLSLTSQVTEFISHVNSSSVTANLDNAEAQLDALVQVLACEEIGWSSRSRKIVILLSDGLMHIAGDGKLGGAIKRNDEQCHLDENGYYSEAGTYDYPSIAQIYRLLDKYKVNVIFAVTENVKGHYDSLHRVLEDFTYIAKLESDSKNILKLVKTGYENVISVVNFKDDSTLGPVKVKYFTDCGIKGGSFVESRRCSGVEFGMTLNYEAHVTLESCPEFKKSKQTIQITESQLGQDSLTLEVDIQCGCDCENGLLQRDMSAACPINSHLVCGVCQCDQGWSGPTCNCSIGDEAASVALSAQCREPNSTRTVACSGTGDCLCGKCECDPGFSGKFCQCKACEISRGENGVPQECGGADRGVCVCGQCACAEGWTGAACDCPERTDTCIAPGDSNVCSEHGDCVCGECKCKSDSSGIKYSGVFCETCSNCENPLCVHAEPCVSCYLEGNCTDVCVTPTANYTVIEELNEPVSDSEGATWCIFRRYDDSGFECQYQYTYNAGTKSMIHMDIIIRRKECSQTTSAMFMTNGLIIMACVIVFGILIIIAVKIAQVIADRRAYAKFAAEAERSMLYVNERQQNPLYISPISEFRLPDDFPRDKYD